MKIVKIIDELARAFVRARKKDSFAVVISVAMAVVVLGTFVFIVEQNRVARIDYIKETIGDYHILLSEQNPAHLRELQEAHKVRAIEFETTDRLPIDDDSNRMASLLLEDKSAWTGDRRVHAGKKPQAPDEVLCEERVLKEMQIEIGDTPSSAPSVLTATVLRISCSSDGFITRRPRRFLPSTKRCPRRSGLKICAIPTPRRAPFSPSTA